MPADTGQKQLKFYSKIEGRKKNSRNQHLGLLGVSTYSWLETNARQLKRKKKKEIQKKFYSS